MRKREHKIKEYEEKGYKLIAVVFMPHRFSQKLGRWETIHEYGNNKDRAMTVPFNFKNFKNPKTIITRLKEFDYVLVHETDIDIIEKLKELNINFKILPIEIKQGCLDRINKSPYISYVSHYWYIKSNFLDLYGLVPKTETYYIIENEYHCPKIKEIVINPKKDAVPPWMNKTKKEAYDKYVYQLKLEIENYSETVQRKKDLLDYFIENNKEIIENELL